MNRIIDKNLKERFLKNIDYEEVTSFVDENNGTIFHEPFLNELISKHYSTKFYYLTNQEGRLQFLCPAHEIKTGIFRHIYYKPIQDIPYGGFIGNIQIGDKNFLKSRHHLSAISYSGIPNIVNDKSQNFHHYGETCMVDLSLSEDEIFKRIINPKRRNMIRKAKKNDIEVRILQEPDGIYKLMPLLIDLHNRLGFLQLKNDFYIDTFKYYSTTGKAVVLLAFHGKEILAGNLILGNKNFMHYYKGASISGVQNYGQGELLQWEGILWSKKNKVRFYDLCIIDKIKFPQIYNFKTGISQVIYRYPIYTQTGFCVKLTNKINKRFATY